MKRALWTIVALSLILGLAACSATKGTITGRDADPAAVPPTSSPSPNALYSNLNHPSDKKCDPQSHDGAGYSHAKALRRKGLGTLRSLRLGVSLLTVTRYR